jgi:copper homeostasis protein
MNTPILEVCTNSLESALAAQQGGAYRVELCENLYEGGTTPSYGTLKLARERLSIKLNVLIRPRGGDFHYSDDEMEILRQNIQLCKKIGVDGVVLGFLTKNGEIDIQRTTEIAKLARPMSVTFHRAFDMCRDPYKALDELIKIGIDRILTSGQRNMATEGVELIAELVKIAGNKIIVMPGAGLDVDNIAWFNAKVGAKEYHSTLWSRVESQMKYKKQDIYMGGLPHIPEFSVMRTDPSKVKQFIARVKTSSCAHIR